MRAVKASPDFAMTVTGRVVTSVMETAVAVQEAFREAQRQAVRVEQLSAAAQSAPDVNTPSDDVCPDLPTVPAHLRLVRVESDKAVVEFPGSGCYACGVALAPEDDKRHMDTPTHQANWRSMNKFRHYCRTCDRVCGDFSSYVSHFGGKRHQRARKALL